MRIIAGKHRGRELQAGQGRAIRPTADRAREAVFNVLAHNEAYRVGGAQMPQNARVLDVFAGTGALGLEAISRGATHATFIDDSPDAIKLMRLNAGTLREIPRVTLLQRDAQSPGRAPAPCNLIFLDPPYGTSMASAALVALLDQGWIADNAIVVAEIGANDKMTIPEKFTLIEEREYGAAKVLFLRKIPEPEKPEAQRRNTFQ